MAETTDVEDYYSFPVEMVIVVIGNKGLRELILMEENFLVVLNPQTLDS